MSTTPSKSLDLIPTLPKTHKAQAAAQPSDTTTACPGYHIEFMAGQSPFMSYVFQIHTTQVLPGSLKTDSLNCLTLHSKKCSGAEKTSFNGKEMAPLPCTSCKNLKNHSVAMGMWHHALKCADENTPRSFLSAGQMVSLLWKKTHIINCFKLQ